MALGVLLGLSVAVTRPHAEEPEAVDEPPAVTESEFDLYVGVYTAMQDDHGLTIDDAIRPRGVTLDEFRQIERRIQNDARMTDRVRQALTDHVKARSLFARGSTPTPSGTAPTPPRPAPSKSRK